MNIAGLNESAKTLLIACGVMLFAAMVADMLLVGCAVPQTPRQRLYVADVVLIELAGDADDFVTAHPGALSQDQRDTIDGLIQTARAALDECHKAPDASCETGEAALSAVRVSLDQLAAVIGSK